MYRGQILVFLLFVIILVLNAGAQILSGALDTSIGNSGKIDHPQYLLDDLSDAVVDPEGRIYLAGASGDDARVIRLLPDGKVDPIFSRQGVFFVPLGPSSVRIGAIAVGQENGLYILADYTPQMIGSVRTQHILALDSNLRL
jgi:streptogramin lyase